MRRIYKVKNDACIQRSADSLREDRVRWRAALLIAKFVVRGRCAMLANFPLGIMCRARIFKHLKRYIKRKFK